MPSKLPGPSDNAASDISLSRIYLPFAMVLTFGAFLLVGGYTAGGVMSGIAHNKTEIDVRLTAIEREMTAIKGILSERHTGAPNTAPCRVR